MKQQQRDRVMKKFRDGKTDILVATDVAARGIDVDDVEAVFNYDLPQDDEYYVHRIGRTGRAGRSGLAISLITSREKYKIESLEEEFIAYVQSEYPSIHILVVLTQFVEEDSDVFVDQLSTQLDGVKVIPVLARDVKLRDGVISAYGVDDINSNIFEGK